MQGLRTSSVGWSSRIFSGGDWRKWISLLILLLAFPPVWGQNPLLNRANRAFEEMSFPEAIRLYERALKKQFNKPALIRLADCYRLTNQYDEAARQYAKVVGLKQLPPINYFYYAQSLMNNGMFREAEKWFRRYQESVPSDPRGPSFAESCRDIEQYFRDSSDFLVSPYRFNSDQDDFGPAWYRDGIIFASSRGDGSVIRSKYEWTQQPFLDLYVARTDPSGGTDTRPRLLNGKLNSRFHEAICSVDEATGLLYFTRNNYFKGKKTTNRSGIVNLKLFYARLTEKGMEELRSLPFNSDEYSVGHPAAAPGTNRLYFASDMPGGYGGTDLYVVERQEDAWSEPENLGPRINTPGNEMFPFVHRDGRLVYASDGLGGLGGLDLFSVSLSAPATSPRNLGAPFNSYFDDFAYISSPDKQWGFFSSNRPGGRGGDDIYRFSVRKPVLAGIVLDQATGQPVPQARVSAAVVASARIERTLTDEAGNFRLLLPPDKNYRFAVFAEGYVSVDQAFNATGIAPGEVYNDTIYLLRPNQPVTFQVLDLATGYGIPDVKVRIIGTQVDYTTDERGEIDLYADPYPTYAVQTGECLPQIEPDYCFRFTDVGGLEMETMPVVYEWDLGDGTRRRGLEVEHCYAAPGNYHVELNLVDTVSGFVFLNQSGYDLEVRPPTRVYIAGPDTVTRGVPVTYDAGSSVLPDCEIGRFAWQIDGQTVGSGPTLPQVFGKVGTYEITLQVTGSAAAGPQVCRQCVTRRVTVQDKGWQRTRKDTLRELWSQEAPIPPVDIECAPQEPESYCYRFTDAGDLDTDSMPFVYEWDLGDGNLRQGRTVEHCYAHPGKYAVVLRILDEYSHQPLLIQAQYEVEVRDVRQVYVNGRDSSRVGQPMAFDAFASDPPEDCTVNAVFWDFGDGERASGPEVVHAYPRPGTFRVRMVLSGTQASGAKCETCTFKEVTVSRNYRGYSIAERQRDRTLVQESITETDDLRYLELSKPGYKTKVLPFRPGEPFADNLATVELEPEIDEIVLAGTIRAQDAPAPLTEVELILQDKGGRELRRFQTAEGNFELAVEPGKSYFLIAEKSGYLQEKVALNPSARDAGRSEPIQLTLREVEIGQAILLQNIFYDFDRHTLREESRPELDRVATILRDNPAIKVELGAHTDARGADDYNLRLSQRRAESAVAYLRKKGIPRDRIVARGYGEQRPVNACINGVECDEWSHQANRRTEIKILGVSDINFKEALLVLEYAAEDSFAAQEAYSIELGVFDDPLPQARLPRGRVFLEQRGGLYTYRIRGYADYATAEAVLLEVKQNGFPEAVIRSNSSAEPLFSPRQVAVPQMAPPGFFYTIQIAVVGRSTPEAFFSPLGPYRKQLQVARVGNLRKYSVCRFDSYKETRRHLNQVRARGYRDAFVIAYRQGRPVPIKEALAYERKLRERSSP